MPSVENPVALINPTVGMAPEPEVKEWETPGVAWGVDAHAAVSLETLAVDDRRRLTLVLHAADDKERLPIALSTLRLGPLLKTTPRQRHRDLWVVLKKPPPMLHVRAHELDGLQDGHADITVSLLAATGMRKDDNMYVQHVSTVHTRGEVVFRVPLC